MTLLICYTNYYGAHVFFLPGAHSMLKPALLETYSSRSRGPSINVRKDKCKTNVTLNYFSNRISTPWNLLSNYTCSATSVNQFITRLDNSLY